MTLGVLFVNVSIGGLTSHAAPPVLMVATTFRLGFRFSAWLGAGRGRGAERGAADPGLPQPGHSVGTGGGVDAPEGADRRPPVPAVVMLVHLAFLVAVVLTAHHRSSWAC